MANNPTPTPLFLHHITLKVERKDNSSVEYVKMEDIASPWKTLTPGKKIKRRKPAK